MISTILRALYLHNYKVAQKFIQKLEVLERDLYSSAVFWWNFIISLGWKRIYCSQNHNEKRKTYRNGSGHP
jgi:hypothetical protein